MTGLGFTRWRRDRLHSERHCLHVQLSATQRADVAVCGDLRRRKLRSLMFCCALPNALRLGFVRGWTHHAQQVDEQQSFEVVGF